MSKAKLTTKLLGKAISTLGKAAPEGPVTYDLVKGFSKKGNFSIYSFRDAAGRLLGRESNYLNGIDDLVEYRNYQYLRNSRYTETVSVLNNSTQKTHKVVKGDSLWAIAQKHYGNGSLYPKIKEANKSKYKSLAKNNIIYVNWELIIP